MAAVVAPLTPSELASVRPGRDVREFQCCLCRPPQYLKKVSFRTHFRRYHKGVITKGWALAKDAGMLDWGKNIEHCQFESRMAEHLGSAATSSEHPDLRASARATEQDDGPSQPGGGGRQHAAVVEPEAEEAKVLRIATADVKKEPVYTDPGKGGQTNKASISTYEDTAVGSETAQPGEPGQDAAAAVQTERAADMPVAIAVAMQGPLSIPPVKCGNAKKTSGIAEAIGLHPANDAAKEVPVYTYHGKGGRAKQASGSTDRDDVVPRALDKDLLQRLLSNIRARRMVGARVTPARGKAMQTKAAANKSGTQSKTVVPSRVAHGSPKRYTQTRLDVIKTARHGAVAKPSLTSGSSTPRSRQASGTTVEGARTGASCSSTVVPAQRKRRSKQDPSPLDGLAIHRSASRSYLSLPQFLWREKWLKQNGFGQKVCRLADAEQCIADGIHADIWGLYNTPTAKGIVSRSVTLEKVSRVRVAIHRAANVRGAS